MMHTAYRSILMKTPDVQICVWITVTEIPKTKKMSYNLIDYNHMGWFTKDLDDSCAVTVRY